MSIFEEIEKQHIIKDPPNKDIMKLLGMINTYPKEATFATQDPDENIVMVVRKHIFRNATWIINTIVMITIPILMVTILSAWDTSFNDGQLMNSDIIENVNSSVLTAVALFYYSFVFTYIYFSYIHWFYDVFIITNQRYVSIDFDILHGRTIVDIPLSDIIDVSEKVLGFLPTLIGYGNIEFKTLSEKFIVLDNIPAPTWFRDSFVDLIHFIRTKENEPAAEKLDEIEKEEEVKEEVNLPKENETNNDVFGNIGDVIERGDLGTKNNSSKLMEP
jgi:uncharacterized membrane protein (DUF485 family)